jgi:hypothetical protein
MYDHGKSDSLIVPEKLPNKGCGTPLSAEEVEERGLASGGVVSPSLATTPPKGNLVQQNRVRTQWRENLQHALERIRQAVPAC